MRRLVKPFISRSKCNKGDVEPIFFIFALLIMLVLIGFSFNIHKLTWQRYSSQRLMQNYSRAYATRWTELYIKDDCVENQNSCLALSLSDIKKSEVYKQLLGQFETTYRQSSVDSMTIRLYKTSSPGVSLIEFSRLEGSDSTNVKVAGYDIAKNLKYGDTLHVDLTVTYTWDSTLRTPSRQATTSFSTKFANEKDISQQGGNLN